MSQIKSMRFVSPGRSRSTSRHPLTGQNFTVYDEIPYDLSTGALFTRESLLADPFHFPGDINHMPIEVLLYATARTASVDISWEGITTNVSTADGHFIFDDNDTTDEPEDTPEDGSENVRVYFPGNSTFGSPDENHSHASIFTRGEVRPNFGGTTSKLRASIFKISIRGRAQKTLTEGSAEDFVADTGIEIPDGEGETYKLYYETISGKVGWVNWGVGGRPVFYSKLDVWGAPVGAFGETREDLEYVRITGYPGFWEWPLGSYPAEWSDTVVALEETLLADNDEKRVHKFGVVGSSRVWPSPNAPDLDGNIAGPSVSVTVTSQVPRFLTFERVGVATF